MSSLAAALKSLVNKEVTIFTNHPDLQTLGGRVTRVEPEHFELLSGDVQFLLPYTALVAVRPT